MASKKTKFRQRRKAELIALLGGKCERCHQHYHPSVFDFHHKDGKDKVYQLNARGIGDRKFSTVLEEVKKTHLLCANCHREVHAFQEVKFLGGLQSV